jgi:hypothetical protein
MKGEKGAGGRESRLLNFIIHYSDFMLFLPKTEAPPPFEDGALNEKTVRRITWSGRP